MQLNHRIQEWAADRFTWVQYPNIRNKRAPVFGFKHAMAWEKRLALVVFGVLALAVCAVVLFFVGVLLYAVIF